MQHKIGKVQICLFLFLLPVLCSAATLASLSADVLDTVRTLVKLLIGLGLAYFLYGTGSYITGLDEKKKRAAKDTMINGIIGLFVMTSIWGIVAAVRTALGI